jgi:hypothetical protein
LDIEASQDSDGADVAIHRADGRGHIMSSSALL